MHHPDRNPDDPTAQDRFSDLNSAYQILSDPDKRAAWDRYGETAFRPGGGGVPPTMNLGDFVPLDGLFGDLLGALGVRVKKSGDVTVKLEVTFEEAARGTDKTVSFDISQLCPRCSGQGGEPGSTQARCASCDGRGRSRMLGGVIPLERNCPHCQGSGQRSTRDCTTCRGAGLLGVKSTRTVNIAAGTENGATMKLHGAGSRVGPDRPAGDVVVQVTVLAHPFFRRDQDDLVCETTVTFAQATLGADIDIQTLEGQARLRIPAGTQPGTTLRMRGKGLPHRHRGGRGDQLVRIDIEIPTNLSPRARALVAELSTEIGRKLTDSPAGLVDRLRNLFD
jgi:molecular chaperone DnaJ